jgi:hypothetical protein
VADAAGFHPDAHLPSCGLWLGALDDFEITSGLANLYGFHANSFLCDLYEGCDEELAEALRFSKQACV